MRFAGFRPASPADFHRLENVRLPLSPSPPSFPLLTLLSSTQNFLNLVFSSAASSDPPSTNARGTLPLTLVSIFCSLIARLPLSYNIQARPIGFPGMVLAAVANRSEERGREEWVYVNIFEGGRVMSEREREELVRRNLPGIGNGNGSGTSVMREEYLRPATAAEMVCSPSFLPPSLLHYSNSHQPPPPYPTHPVHPSLAQHNPLNPFRRGPRSANVRSPTDHFLPLRVRPLPLRPSPPSRIANIRELDNLNSRSRV